MNTDNRFIDIYGRHYFDGTDLSSRTIMGLSAFNSGVNLLSGALAGAELIVKQNRKRVPAHKWKKALSIRPNQYCGKTQLWESFWNNVLIHQNGFLYINKENQTLTNMNPGGMDTYRVTDEDGDSTKWYWDKNNQQFYSDDEIIHVMGFSDNGVFGIPLLEQLQGTFDFATTIQTFTKTFFANGTHITKYIAASKDLTDEQFKQAQANLTAYYTGAKLAGKAPILAPGLDIKTLPVNNEQSQLVQLNQYSVEEIARILRIPPILLYQGALPSGTADALNEHFIDFSLTRWVRKLKDELLKILTEDEIDSDYLVDISLANITNKPITESEVNNGVFTVNEYREELGYEPFPGGDVPRTPAYLVGKDLGSDNGKQLPSDVEAAAGEPTATPAGEAGDAPAATGSSYKATLSAIVGKAADRVDARALNVLEKQYGKPTDAAWRDRFASTQADYLSAELEPIAATYAALSGDKLDTAELVAKYKGYLQSLGEDSLYRSGLLTSIGDLIK